MPVSILNFTLLLLTLRLVTKIFPVVVVFISSPINIRFLLRLIRRYSLLFELRIRLILYTACGGLWSGTFLRNGYFRDICDMFVLMLDIVLVRDLIHNANSDLFCWLFYLVAFLPGVYGGIFCPNSG